jgi:hypothetical protein
MSEGYFKSRSHMKRIAMTNPYILIDEIVRLREENKMMHNTIDIAVQSLIDVTSSSNLDEIKDKVYAILPVIRLMLPTKGIDK